MSEVDEPEVPAWLTAMLQCPVTGAPLRVEDRRDGTSELVATTGEARLAYPVRDGAPVLLAHEAREVS